MKELFNNEALSSAGKTALVQTGVFGVMLALAGGPLVAAPFLGVAFAIPYYIGYAQGQAELQQEAAPDAEAATRADRPGPGQGRAPQP